VQFSDWLKTPLAEKLLISEQTISKQWLETVFGYHAVHMGDSATQCLMQSRIPHSVFISDAPYAYSLRAELDQLPLKSDSVDLIVMPHVLEFHLHPHMVLREVSRILISEGTLLITGFNPHSIWGLRRYIDKKNGPWAGHFLSIHRMHDWLELMGFTLIQTKTLFYRVPITGVANSEFSDRVDARLSQIWPYGGAVYMMLAQKRVSTLTPIPLKATAKRKLLPGWQPTGFSISQKNKVGKP